MYVTSHVSALWPLSGESEADIDTSCLCSIIGIHLVECVRVDGSFSDADEWAANADLQARRVEQNAASMSFGGSTCSRGRVLRRARARA